MESAALFLTIDRMAMGMMPMMMACPPADRE
jgi:hypothetical protein